MPAPYDDPLDVPNVLIMLGSGVIWLAAAGMFLSEAATSEKTAQGIGNATLLLMIVAVPPATLVLVGALAVAGWRVRRDRALRTRRNGVLLGVGALSLAVVGLGVAAAVAVRS